MENERSQGKKRALIVDDDDPIRMMLTKVVEREELEVETARDGEEAIARIDDDGYSVILLDLMMPRIDGFGVLRYLQEHRPDLLCCTIIASAVPESEILRHFDVPVHSVQPKPFDMQKLLGDIRACAAK